MLLSSFFAAYRRIYTYTASLPLVVFDIIKSLSRLALESTVRSEDPSLLFHENLISCIAALCSIDERALPTTYLQSVESALGQVSKCISTVYSSQELQSDIARYITDIKAILLEYRRSFERALAKHDGFCFRPNYTENETANIRVPEEIFAYQRKLNKCLKDVVAVLQTFPKSRKVYFWNRGTQKKINQCRTDVRDVLRSLEIYLLPKNIFQASLESSSATLPLHVMQHATPKRYRLVDCSCLLEHNSLHIDEFVHFPYVPYAAISYVWRGNDVPIGYTADEFSIAGAEEADPIGVAVLKDACTAALAKGARYIWMDRLCIMQTNKDDKDWQIREMYRMYQSCIVCIVLPGGLRRLVPIDEETGWIHRAWTLQESLAPPSVFTVFAWKFGPCEARTGDQFWDTTIEEVIPGRSAMTTLPLLLDACTAGFLLFKFRDQSVTVQVKLFAANRSSTVVSPNVTALSVLMHHDSDAYVKQYAVWKSAFMRTSSRPVDMVFSIMGLFGVSLDPKAFDKDDRIGATIALAKQILDRGGRASWLGVSPFVQPCPYLSTFPTFPRTRVSGKALLRVADGIDREVVEFMDSDYPYLLAPASFVHSEGNSRGTDDNTPHFSNNEPISLAPIIPKGSMKEDGYLTFKAKAVQVRLARNDNVCSSRLIRDYDDDQRPTLLKDTSGNIWEIPSKVDESVTERPTFAVVLGLFVGFFAATVPSKMIIKAMLIEEHDERKFHLRSYFSLDFESRNWIEAIWKEREFCVGGPDVWGKTGGSGERGEEGTEEYTRDDWMDIPKLASHSTLVKFRDKVGARSRTALPQLVLEDTLLGN